MSELTAAPEREAWMPFLFAAEPGAEDEAAAVRPGVLLLGVEVERDDGEDVSAMDPPAQMAAGHAVVASVAAEKPAEAPGSMADRVREALEVKPEPAGAAVTAHARVVFGDGETSVSVAVRAHDDHVFVRATAGGDMAAAFVAHADELRVALRRHGLDLAEVSAQTRPGQDDGRPRGERREERPNQEEQQPRRRGEERT